MDIHACTARVLNTQGEICGTAFLVGEDRLLTSARAAGYATHTDLSREDPLVDVLIDFPGTAPGKTLRAEIIAWQQDEMLDYAVLAPQDPLPQGTVPAAIVPVGNAKTSPHPTLAFGFPDGMDSGMSALCELTQAEKRGWMQIELVKQVGLFAQHGFSGAPVIDPEMGAVIGMVITPAERPDTAFMIPLERIAGDWPQLIGEAFLTVQRSWRSNQPKGIKISEGQVESPLNDAWRRFIQKPSWNDRLSKKLSDITQSAHAFDELQPLVQAVVQVDTSENYESIRANLDQINQRRDLIQTVDQLITRFERKTLLSAGQIRGSRYNPSLEEEQQLSLDGIRQNLHDLREFARNPEYGRCFFVLGGMGSGKTHFIGVDLMQSSAVEGSLVLNMQHAPLGSNFEALLLANLHAASGVNWPDLELFDQLLHAYSSEFLSGLPVRLVVAIDDLGQWERMHSGFIESMIHFIRRTTRLHHIYWLICCSHSSYNLAADKTAEIPHFWNHYGDNRNPDLSYIDRWLVLDDLNRDKDTGVRIIQEGLKKRADKEEVSLAITKAGDEGTLARLYNPQIALAFLEQTKTIPADRALHQNFIDFIEAFWKLHIDRLISSEQNQKAIHPPLQPDELKRLAALCAQVLAGSQSVLIPKDRLIQALAETNAAEEAALPAERIGQALDLLVNSMVMTEHDSAVSIQKETQPEIEVSSASFWAPLLAREVVLQAKGHIHGLDIEAAFLQIAPHLRGSALAFFLLMLDGQSQDQGDHAAILACCDQILSSSALPHAPVWTAGAKSSQAIQKGLLERARSAVTQPADGEALIALLHFFSEMPVSLIPVPDRFAILQPLYSQIKPGGYAAYFYYVVRKMFEQLDSTDELAISMIYLSGCEATGLTEALSDLCLETMLTFYDESGPSSVFLARWLLDYMAEIVGEYRDRGSIPGQEKGWRRTLFREYVLNSFLRYLCRKERLNIYTLLKDVHWYDDRRFRTNPVLALQKEREANIAIGALFRYDSKEGFIKFAQRLVESRHDHDRRNAFFILRHSEHVSDERPIPILDERFQPFLESLFLDPALDRILQSQSYYELFRRNLRNFQSLERQRLNR